MQDAAAQADFIFLCGPISVLEEQLQTLANLNLKPGCIISDVGSTKQSIMLRAAALHLKNAYFIGGHPMAGSERSGVEAASVHLFENAFYVLTPAEDTPVEAYLSLERLLSCTKAQMIKLDAEQHDAVVGAISHLPHLLVAALVNQVAAYNRGNDLYQTLVAGGFLDFTRIASSEPAIWRDILLHNREVLMKLLQDWNVQIANFISLLEQADGEGIEQQFIIAKQFRSSLSERRKGKINALFDIYVDVPDHPGIIGNIASELGKKKINLSNIQIIEGRLDVPGVLRLSFREEEHMEKAAVLLKEMSYSINF